MIYGANETGKTALCEWLAGLSDTSPLERWQIGCAREADYTVKVANPIDHSIKVMIAPKTVRYAIDGGAAPANPIAIKFVHVRHFPRPFRDGAPDDDLEYLASSLRISRQVLLNFLPLVPSTGVFVKHLKLEANEDGGDYISTTVSSTVPNLPFLLLSDGETRIVLIEVAISLAHFYSRFHPTMLMVELGELASNDDAIATYWNHLQSAHFQFQTVFTTHDLESIQPHWMGWGLVRLEGSPPNMKVLQDEI